MSAFQTPSTITPVIAMPIATILWGITPALVIGDISVQDSLVWMSMSAIQMNIKIIHVPQDIIAIIQLGITPALMLMNVSRISTIAAQTLHAQILMDHSHVHVIQDTLGME